MALVASGWLWKDWSKFKEPRDTSKRDAEKDLKLTILVKLWLKFKSIFSNKAKRELEEKRKEAKVLLLFRKNVLIWLNCQNYLLSKLNLSEKICMIN